MQRPKLSPEEGRLLRFKGGLNGPLRRRARPDHRHDPWPRNDVRRNGAHFTVLALRLLLLGKNRNSLRSGRIRHPFRCGHRHGLQAIPSGTRLGSHHLEIFPARCPSVEGERNSHPLYCAPQLPARKCQRDNDLRGLRRRKNLALVPGGGHSLANLDFTRPTAKVRTAPDTDSWAVRLPSAALPPLVLLDVERSDATAAVRLLDCLRVQLEAPANAHRLHVRGSLPANGLAVDLFPRASAGLP